MIRFTPARTYLSAAAVALGLAVFSGWCAARWLPAAIPAILFAASAALTMLMGLRPAIEVSDTHLKNGNRVIPWSEIRRVDQTGWISPLVVDLTLADDTRIRLFYAGETVNSNRLLRLIQQHSNQALINGVPYRSLFGEPKAEQDRKALPSPRYRLLTEEDEAEVERMFQKLRTAGRIDPEK